jgi:ubiquitin-protein ligase
MSGLSVRVAVDTERLRGLMLASGGRISLLSVPNGSMQRFLLDLRFTTAGSSVYPNAKQPVIRLAIDLPARYPFQPPVATITTPIFHPNVFASGLVCQGAKWLPSEGMDLFVRRIAKLVTFDPLLVNAQSAANGEAMRWYVRAVRETPHAFPSDRVEIVLAEEERPKVQWQAAPVAERVVKPCPACGTKLRLPAGKTGTVNCPGCGVGFEART